MNSALKGLPLAVMAAVALAGCAREGHFDDRNEEYVDSRLSTPLTLPDSRDARGYRDIMPVPQVSGEFYAREEGFEAPVPQSLSATTAVQAGGVAVRETDDDSWLVVGAEPAVVWPELERFVSQRGLSVTQSDSARGLIQTADADLTLRSGLRAGTSEIRCDTGGQINSLCLNSLQRHFEARSASASIASGAQQSAPGAATVDYRRQGDNWVMVVPVDIDRAYAEINYQLANNFEMQDRRELVSTDAASRSFVLDYITESDRTRGLIDSITSFELGESMRRIELSLAPQGSASVAAVRSLDDEPLSADDQRELLERVAALLL
ncbi:hypothetical protein [Halomonas huangheensis]|nr:hypothetical protein [Halomonas huangheensis]